MNGTATLTARQSPNYEWHIFHQREWQSDEMRGDEMNGNLRIEYLCDHPQHIPELGKWLFGEWGHLNVGDTLEARTERLRLHSGRLVVPTTLIALEGDTLVGSASLVGNDLAIRPRLGPFLASVFVRPEQRKKGIASALVRRAVSDATSLNYTKLYLITHDQQKLYANLGWSPLEEMEYRGESITLMKVDCAV